jgi:hypothetical protein
MVKIIFEPVFTYVGRVGGSQPVRFGGSFEWCDHPLQELGFSVFLPFGKNHKMNKLVQFHEIAANLKEPFSLKGKKDWRVVQKEGNPNRLILRQVGSSILYNAEKLVGKFWRVSGVRRCDHLNAITVEFNGRFPINVLVPFERNELWRMASELHEFFIHTCTGGINLISTKDSIFENQEDEFMFLTRFAQYG